MRKLLVILLLFTNIVAVQSQTKKVFDKFVKTIPTYEQLTRKLYSKTKIDTLKYKEEDEDFDYVTYPNTDSLFVVTYGKVDSIIKIRNYYYTVTYLDKKDCISFYYTMLVLMDKNNITIKDLDEDTRKKYLNCKQKIK